MQGRRDLDRGDSAPRRAAWDAVGDSPDRFRRALLAWYDRNRRPLPWRIPNPDPYHVWIAEIMLQQTQVATVLPYWRRFIDRFPDVRSLAAASVDDVLRLWAGLGYYRRAHLLHDAARMIDRLHGGRLPADPKALRALPGIGRYTAGAIASIAFGLREPLLDGNVARVLERVTYGRGASRDRATRDGRRTAALWRVAGQLVPARRPGDFNQALMDLGAMVCLPARPLCGDCPLARFCGARAAGVQDRVPLAGRSVRRQTIEVAAVVVRRGGRVLLGRRPPGGLWGGLWDVPSRPVDGGASPRVALRPLLRELRISPPARAVGVVEGLLTHRAYRAHVFTARGDGTGRRPPDGYRWCDLRGADFPVSRFARRVIDLATAVGPADASRPQPVR